MATVFKRPNSKFYQCAFTSATGRRVYKSTRETKKAKAREVAVELEKRARNLDALGQQEQRAILGVLEEASVDALRGKLTEEQAREYLERLLHLSGSDSILKLPSVAEWFRDWQRGKERTTSGATALRYLNIIESFLDFLPQSERAAPLSAINAARIQSYRDHLSDEGKSASTANLHLKTLRMALGQAKKQNLIRVNPAETVEILRARSEQKQAFTADQVRRLADTARRKAKTAKRIHDAEIYNDWTLAILVAYFTGQRQSDVIGLTWKQIDLEKLSITLRQVKTGKNLVLPIHPELARELEAKADSTLESSLLFPCLAGKTSAGRNGLSGMFRRLIESAGIENPELNGSPKGRKRSALTFHSLRHAFNTHLAQSGVQQEIRQLLTGHASKAVNDQYTHLGLESLRTAVNRLPNLGG